MATPEEKQELVEALKGPHFYRIQLWGYGGEASYMNISEEAFNFWKENLENGDSDAVHYVTSSEDKTPSEMAEEDDIEHGPIPREAMFLHEEDNEPGSSWYEPPNEFDHTWGVAVDSARITIEKVDSIEYNAKSIEDVVDGEDLNEFAHRIGEETDWEVEICNGEHSMGNNFPEKGSYVFQFYSSEKGTFFEGRFESATLFDPKKLKVLVAEAPNGEDTVYGVEYDGTEIDNDGGDTNGKGYYAYVWKQEV